MTAARTIDTRHLGDGHYRDLQVYYDKGGMSYWDYSKKPKGIYFASHIYSKSGTGTATIISWSTSQKGDGYLLVTELSHYSAKALRLVQDRVRNHAVLIHDILDGTRGAFADLQAVLQGDAITIAAPQKEAA